MSIPRWSQAFAAGLTLLLAWVYVQGCRRKAEVSSGTVVVARARDVSTLDPALATDVDSADVLVQLFDTLVKYDDRTFDIKPALAVRWTKSTDLKTWTFHLRKRVRFHDGTPMDARSVKYSFDRQSQGGPGQKKFDYWNSSFADIIHRVESVGKYTVRITLTRPFAPFLASLAMFPVSIVSKPAVKKSRERFEQNPVGTGPFRFVRWDRKNGIITLEAFKKHWGGAPKIKRLVFKRIRDARQRVRALESGTVHVIRDVDPRSIQMVRLHPDLNLIVRRGNSVCYLAMNTQQPPFNNPHTRWGVNRAIRKKVLVKLIYQGLAEEASGPLPPILAWAYTSEVTRYPHNVKTAKEDLKAAGYIDDPSNRPTLYVMDSPRPYLLRPVLAAQMIARDLKAVGMPVRIVIQPFKKHVDSMKNGEHDLALYGWVGDNGDPDNFLYTLLYPRSPLNVAHWRDANYARLVESARQTRDQQARGREYIKAQQLATRQAPWVPLAHTKMVVAMRREVHNLILSPSSLVYFYRAELK